MPAQMGTRFCAEHSRPSSLPPEIWVAIGAHYHVGELDPAGTAIEHGDVTAGGQLAAEMRGAVRTNPSAIDVSVLVASSIDHVVFQG